MPDERDERSALDEMNRVLDVGPTVHEEPLAGDTRFTRSWGHGPIHDRTAPMTHHVVMTYYGAPQRIEWRQGTHSVRSFTRSGTLTLIPALHEARWDVHGPIEVSHVYLPDARLRVAADALHLNGCVELLDRVGHDDPITSRLLEILALEADASEPAQRLFHEQTVDLLCLRLVQAHSAAARVASPEPRGLAAWQVKRTTDYLNAHLDEPVGLDELAALVGLSRFHFCTAFRIATGITPHRWLVQRRMTEAKRLLCDPRLSVTHVALAVGYGSTSAFIATFRKITGTTPTAFRRAR